MERQAIGCGWQVLKGSICKFEQGVFLMTIVYKNSSGVVKVDLNSYKITYGQLGRHYNAMSMPIKLQIDQELFHLARNHN